MSVPDEQDDFIFRPQQHLDAKWLNPDLQDALHSPEALCAVFNSLIQDREIYFDSGNGLLNTAGITAKLGDSGKYYCGLRVRSLHFDFCEHYYVLFGIYLLRFSLANVIIEDKEKANFFCRLL